MEQNIFEKDISTFKFCIKKIVFKKNSSPYDNFNFSYKNLSTNNILSLMQPSKGEISR